MSEHAISNARGWLETIRAQVAILNEAEAAKDWAKADEAREAIQESALSVRVRDDWRSPGEGRGEPAEYEILLSTGGPALRVTGELDAHCQPDEWPALQWQDWFEPWTTFPIEDDADREALATFVGCYWFGE